MNELHLRKQYLSCIKTFFTLAILFFVLILFTSCNPDINSPVDVQDISLSNTDINLNVGETATVYATIYPFDATYSEISWNSSNPNVASVEHGYIKAISTGETIISAHAGSALAICRVIVTEELNDIRISDSTCWLKSGEKYQLTYSVKPDNYEKNDIPFVCMYFVPALHGSLWTDCSFYQNRFHRDNKSTAKAVWPGKFFPRYRQ